MMPAGSFMERIMSSTVTVKENGQGRYQQEIRAGKHQYLADEPVDM